MMAAASFRRRRLDQSFDFPPAIADALMRAARRLPVAEEPLAP